MVKRAASLDSVFAALADPTRRLILQGLMGGHVRVGRLARPFRISAPAISRHLRVLERAGLIHRTKRGRTHEIELSADPLRRAGDWIGSYRHFWESNLDSLARYLESGAPSPAPKDLLKTKQRTAKRP